MKENVKNILTISVFITVTALFSIVSRVVTPPHILANERRPAAVMPEFSADSVVSADFMRKFENFAADNIFLREELRTVRAAYVFKVLRQTDKDGLYTDSAVGAGKFAAVKEAEYRKTAAKLRRVADILPDDMNIYYSVIPDKSYYAASRFPGYSPETAERILMEELPDFTYIRLSDTLGAGSYYRTDLHWKQTSLAPVLETLGTAMTGSRIEMPDIDVKNAGIFTGVYPGQLALPMSGDEMLYFDLRIPALYLDDKTLEMKDGPVYDEAAFRSVDPYSFFLRGPQPLISLDGGGGDGAKCLYIFRDSFTSSLAPLIAASKQYRNVVLIDLRYIDSRLLEQYAGFEKGGDVLFLYGSQIFNNAGLLKVH